MNRIMYLLSGIYSDTAYADAWQSLWAQWSTVWTQKKKQYLASKKDSQHVEYSTLSQDLALLITYGDSLVHDGEKPLKILHRFLERECEGVINGVHILPYFPYTSDDGFAISDYTNVREDLGDWSDIEAIADDYYMMSDLVLNHCSSKHEWFLKFLQGEKPYDEYFIVGDVNDDYSSVVRPRPNFILSEYQTTQGKKHVWTTFSIDQVDMNFGNPLVLFEMLDVLFQYILEHGSRLIRLDAIAYLWKELGTPCIHHRKTHLVVQLMRALLDEFTSGVLIITETNVPHEENISYFGNNNESNLVYQFSLPPLILYSMVTENTHHLQRWAKSLPPVTEHTTYFNFCSSHDGIGVTPTHGILDDKERNVLIESVKKQGGIVSYKATPQGKIPYELNINYLSAVAPEEYPVGQRADMFLASQSIMLAMPGVPGIYIHSLLGSENWHAGVRQMGYNRAINRERISYDTLIAQLDEPESLRHRVFNGHLQFLEARKKSTAFHPAAKTTILDVSTSLFALLRETDTECVLCVTNVTEKEIGQTFPSNILPWQEGGVDLLSDDIIFVPVDATDASNVSLILEPYEVTWLRFPNQKQ